VSAWILGSEVAGSLGLRDFEFVQEYVAKGLSPHNEQGQPFMPAAAVDQFIQRLEHELAIHEDTAWNLLGDDRDELIANHIDPLQRRIHGYRLYLESLNGAGWQDFELPADQDLSRHFIQVLLNSLYRRDEVYGRLSPEPEPVPDQEPAQPVKVVDQVQVAVKGRKLTPEQRHKIDSRAAAQKIWSESPEMTIQDMIQRDEIANACEGVVYGEKTIRNWIKDLCPDRKPGRRKEKSS
jgi:hypothetical protein